MLRSGLYSPDPPTEPAEETTPAGFQMLADYLTHPSLILCG